MGNDPAKWQRISLPLLRIRYKNVYPGIDLLYYGNQRQLNTLSRYAPKADAQANQFEIKGTSKLHIGNDGSLVLQTLRWRAQFQRPSFIRKFAGFDTSERCLRPGTVRIVSVSDSAAYDRNKALVIDPLSGDSTYRRRQRG